MVPLEQAKKLSLHVEKPIGRSGTWRLAQKIRRWSHYQTYLSGPYKWAHPVIETEMQLCATVQRESFLKEEIQKVHTNSIGHDEKQLQNWAEELVLLDQEYWRLERTLYIAQCNVNGYVRIVRNEVVAVADNANAAKGYQIFIG
ncbi:hypothetical protein N7471_004046 [Penicillium samsonianum]|uniref:uncharacterized protein n=1 Tax=Penicillium samsonianum TaxID=1882272 RepID=UPI002547F60C|nr:uncharacterized protein N7471_004046 [Penicillium samsonianum]KAJ6137560.1 hypothetical protein N7471_004046 [Penicillium samsonianum]